MAIDGSGCICDYMQGQIDKMFRTNLSLLITIVLKVCVQPMKFSHCFNANGNSISLNVQMPLFRKQGCLWDFIEETHIIHIGFGPL